MKTYLATVCLTKTYTDKMCNQVLLQKEFPDEKAAHEIGRASCRERV